MSTEPIAAIRKSLAVVVLTPVTPGFVTPPLNEAFLGSEPFASHGADRLPQPLTPNARMTESSNAAAQATVIVAAVNGDAACAHHISREPWVLLLDMERCAKVSPVAVTDDTAAPAPLFWNSL